MISLPATMEPALVMDSLVNFSKLIFGFLKELGLNTKAKQSSTGIVLILVGVHAYYWHKYSFWRRRNLKTPTPVPFFGNLLSLALHPRQHLEVEWPKKYGKVYGMYLGTRPYLVCADASVLKKICIKDFDVFPNHYMFGYPNKYQKHFLIMQKDNHWRGMRAVITPTFTSGKMKVMYNILDTCAEELALSIKDEMKAGGKAIIDCRELFGAFSMGSAVSSFYGIKLKNKMDDTDNDDSNTKAGFAKRSQIAFNPSGFRVALNYLLPKLFEIFRVHLVTEKKLDFFAEKADKIIEHRLKAARRYNDFLQLLLEARADSELEEADSDKHEEHHALLSYDDKQANGDATAGWRSLKMNLTKKEVSCQVMMLMTVATETTATLLSHICYLLAYHPEIQENLYKELMAIRDPSENLDENTSKFHYEKLTSCIYLDAVVSEALRLMPPAISLDRMTSEDYYIEDYNVHVPKGTIVNLAFFGIHRDPDYWPEPEKFDPNRFMPERKPDIVPGSYCPFGIGPRSCIGFRFALTEVKVAIAKLLTEFEFKIAPGTKYPPEPRRMTFVINTNKNLLVQFETRKSAFREP